MAKGQRTTVYGVGSEVGGECSVFVGVECGVGGGGAGVQR